MKSDGAVQVSNDDDDRLSRLERKGVIHRAQRGPLDQVVQFTPIAARPGGDIVAAILADRRTAAR